VTAVKPAKAATAVALRQQRHRARRAAAHQVEFIRADWASFLNPDRLPQKAGCPHGRLRGMILKEVTDNALDTGAAVVLERIDDDTWSVADQGSGLERAQVVRYFAVDRPMTSTKLVRRPLRGAIGNGLRLITGGVLASGGALWVESRGVRYRLDVDRVTGATVVRDEEASDVLTGTRVTVAFGPALARSTDDAQLARLAVECAGPAARPMRSHPSWYDSAAFAELVEAAEPGTTVAAIAALLGVALDDDRPAAVADLDLLQARAGTPPVLAPLGADRFAGSYAKEQGRRGEIPVLAEAWVTACRCRPSRGGGTVTLLINRSPVVAPVRIVPGNDKRLVIWGCNLAYVIDRVSPGAAYQVVLGVTSPAVPVTTEGKEPDLESLWPTIEPALAKAMRKAHHGTDGGAKRGDIKVACYAEMEQAYRKAAGGEGLANARQVYYASRPLVEKRLGPEVKLGDQYFLQHLLPDFIAGHPELTATWDIVWDARGHLAEPHTGVVIPVGTLQVREYLQPRRPRPSDLISIDASLYPTLGPENRFKTLLYIEKEGFDPLLRRARIAERFDCAVMSTKGISVTAARQIVDRHAQQGVRILVLHDFDRSGACIAHTLGNDTRRYGFKADPQVVDLGLTLADARAMGLLDEAAPNEGPGEDKLREYGLGEEEIEFLVRQGRRFELNAMSSDQFRMLLEAKLAEHGAGKVVPKVEVLEQHARRVLGRRFAADRMKPVIEEAKAKAAGVVLPVDLAGRVRAKLEARQQLSWDEAVDEILADVTPPAVRPAS
jgi:hypothetical protein